MSNYGVDLTPGQVVRLRNLTTHNVGEVEGRRVDDPSAPCVCPEEWPLRYTDSDPAKLLESLEDEAEATELARRVEELEGGLGALVSAAVDVCGAMGTLRLEDAVAEARALLREGDGDGS